MDRPAASQGTPVTVPITLTNTGNTTKDFSWTGAWQQVRPCRWEEPRLPLPGSGFAVFFVPSETTQLRVAAESTGPSMPINMDVANLDGAPPFGGTGAPDIEAAAFRDSSGNYAAAAAVSAPTVAAGPWGAFPTEVGPYPAAAPSTTVNVGGTAITQPFDHAVTSSTGDLYALLAGQSIKSYTPLNLAPSATGTIVATITPSAAVGTVVRGFLYIDSIATSNNFLTTGNGDELIAIPYSYTVK